MPCRAGIILFPLLVLHMTCGLPPDLLCSIMSLQCLPSNQGIKTCSLLVWSPFVGSCPSFATCTLAEATGVLCHQGSQQTTCPIAACLYCQTYCLGAICCQEHCRSTAKLALGTCLLMNSVPDSRLRPGDLIDGTTKPLLGMLSAINPDLALGCQSAVCLTVDCSQVMGLTAQSSCCWACCLP